jgi:hypothetical protein
MTGAGPDGENRSTGPYHLNRTWYVRGMEKKSPILRIQAVGYESMEKVVWEDQDTGHRQ